MKIHICKKCLTKNKVGGRVQGQVCKKCGYPLDAEYVPQNEPKTKERKPKKEVIIQTKEVKIEGEFKQYGVLCLDCKTVTPFGNKKCQNCRNKLRISPKTTVYYNGVKEAIQCAKCGKYSQFKGIECEYCKKKFKF